MTPDPVKTSLHALHEELGARIVPFSGWAMPLEYEGTVSEHHAVRDRVGVFDVSHLGSVWVAGPDAEDVISVSFTNDPGSLEDGRSQYTLCCTEDGGIVDDLIVYRLAGDRFLAVPNAANTRAVADRLRGEAADREATVDDASRQLSIIAVQGPDSLDLLRSLYPDVVDRVPYRGIGAIRLGPSDEGWLCRTGYTGEVGAELLLPGTDAPGVFRELVDQGATPAGLGARDTLRLEMGYPLHGNDLSTDTDPYEAGLSWAVKLDHGDFQGRDALRRREEEGPSRRLLGMRALDRGIPREGMAVRRDRQDIGTVTSGSYSPTLEVGIGLGYLEQGIEPGDEVTVDVRGKGLAFTVVDPPFVDRDPRG